MDPFPPRLATAAVWTGRGIELQQIPIPQPGAGETLVRIRLATICGSDLHTVAGRRPAPCPSILGHESVGEVVAIGAGSSAVLGDRVVWSVTVSCGNCHRCRSGRTAKCLTVRKFGHEPLDGPWPLSGGYADYALLPAGTTIVAVPTALPDSVAAPAACATATVMAAIEAAGAPAERVLICGAGMLGVTAAAVCADAGARVYVDDIDTHRQSAATEFGAQPDQGDAVDLAIDFSGATTAIQNALSRLDIGGTLVLAGSVTPSPPIEVVPENIVRNWHVITGVHNYEPHHLTRAIEFLDRTRDRYPWESVVAEPTGLHDLADGLHVTGRSLRAAVDPSRPPTAPFVDRDVLVRERRHSPEVSPSSPMPD
ncbi:zinc-binding dehydrogenase [Nocardia sp. NPDC050717]|uniref:zinc-binding dehydrogenase n=1 Tax=Nocardia sp. NPDC050717 TaxID=3157221 RepID=UPI0033D7F244